MKFQHVGIVLKNQIRRISFATLISVSLAGCTLQTHDSLTDKGPLKLTLPSEACLKNAIPVVVSYFQGTAAADETNTAWACVSGALTAFTVSTRGANQDFYSARELRTFLQTYYLGDIKISDPLLSQFMQVKQLILGGGDDRLTRAELAQAQTIVEIVRVESLRIRPYMMYLTQQVPIDETLGYQSNVEGAIAAFQTTVNAFSELFGTSPIIYATEDLQTLLEELRPIFTTWAGPEKAISAIPTFEALKPLILNLPGNRISPSEWRPLITNMGRGYALYLRHHYLMSQQDLVSGPGLVQAVAAFEELTTIMKGAIEVKPSRQIAFQLLDSAIDELIRLDFVDARIQDTTLKSAMRAVVSKMFNPVTNGVRQKVKGLNQTVLMRMHSVVAAFFEMQRAYSDVVSRAVNADATLKGQPVPWKTFVPLWSSEKTSHPDAQDDLRQLFTQASPLSYRDNGTVVFDNRLSFLPLTAKSFTRYNWQSGVMRLLVQGYATDAAANRFIGLSRDQVKALYGDARALLTDIQVVDASDDTLWQSVFSESNMFTLSAMNDDRLSYFEAFDYLSYILGASTTSARLYQNISESCARAGVDGSGQQTFDIACFRTRYGQDFAAIHAELPWWVKTQADAGPGGWIAIEKALEMAARVGGYTDAPIGSSDMTRIAMIMQYIESLFVRFDVNRDGVIDYGEAQKALPLFRSLLVSASGFKSDKKINALYTYILKKGRAPTSFGDKLYFEVIWLNSKSAWESVTADRVQLLNVVGALKKAANPK